MISYDPKKLEVLDQFSGFLDFLKNPGETAKIVEEAKAIVKEMKDLVGPYSTVEQANKYLSDSKVTAASDKIQAQALLDSAKEEAVVLKEKAKSFYDGKVKDLAEKEEEVKSALLKVVTDKEAIEVSKKSQENLEKAIAKLKEELEQKLEALDKAKTDYEDKLAKIKLVIE